MMSGSSRARACGTRSEMDVGDWQDPVNPDPFTTLEATPGQISSKSPTDATSGRWHLDKS
jgi:hypothetical protein